MTQENSSELPDIAIKPVPFVETIPDGRLRCRVCEFRCIVEPGALGTCKVRTNKDGQLIATNYGLISRADLGRIEQRRFYHLFPGARIFSVGGFGQNFPPLGTEDQYSVPSASAAARRSLPLDKLIKFAIERQCRGVVFAYNEPSMWYEYLQEAVQMVKANGMFSAIVTNGYFSKEALDTMGHYIGGMQIEVNAFSESTFNVLTGQNYFQKVLETATLALKKYKVHIEIHTRLVPGINDGETELKTIATWIRQVLGENIPWHISSPIADAQPNIEQAVAIGKDCGLHYIYTESPDELASGLSGLDPDNRRSDNNTEGGDTYCFNCHHLVIERSQTETIANGVESGHCAYCGTDLHVHNTIWKL